MRRVRTPRQAHMMQENTGFAFLATPPDDHVLFVWGSPKTLHKGTLAARLLVQSRL